MVGWGGERNSTYAHDTFQDAGHDDNEEMNPDQDEYELETKVDIDVEDDDEDNDDGNLFSSFAFF